MLPAGIRRSGRGDGDDFSFVEKEWEPLMAVEYRHRHNVMWFIFLFIALVIAAMAAYQHGWIG